MSDSQFYTFSEVLACASLGEDALRSFFNFIKSTSKIILLQGKVFLFKSLLKSKCIKFTGKYIVLKLSK